jgi:hypothetical protein
LRAAGVDTMGARCVVAEQNRGVVVMDLEKYTDRAKGFFAVGAKNSHFGAGISV